MYIFRQCKEMFMFQHEHTEQLDYGKNKSKYRAQTWTDLGFIERLRVLLLISSKHHEKVSVRLLEATRA